MKRFLILFIMACSTALLSQGYAQTPKRDAKRLHKEIGLRLQTLAEHRTDSAAYYQQVQELLQMALTCDSLDALPDSRGRVHLDYTQENSTRLSPLLPTLIDAGIFEYRRGNSAQALTTFLFYLHCLSRPMFHEKDNHEGIAAYYSSLLFYGKDNFREAEHYADIALQYPAYAKNAAEIKINCMKNSLHSPTDTLRYVSALTALHDIDPGNAVYFKMLIDHHSAQPDSVALHNFAVDELKRHARNKQVWMLNGELAMKAKQWEKAIYYFKEAEKRDKVYVQAIYDVAICYASWAQELTDSLNQQRKRLRKKDALIVKGYYQQARQWLLKTSHLDEKQSIVEWKRVLDEVNKVLGLH